MSSNPKMPAKSAELDQTASARENGDRARRTSRATRRAGASVERRAGRDRLCRAIPSRPKPRSLPKLRVTKTDEPELERYMRDDFNPLTGVTTFSAEPSTRMRRGGFPIGYMSLGTDIEEALAVYHAEFAPVLRRWEEDRTAIAVDDAPVFGSLDWMLTEYKKTERFAALSKLTKEQYENNIRRCGRHVVRAGRFAGRRFGSIPVKRYTEADADQFYAEYVVTTKADGDGNEVETRRATMAKRDIETLRAMLNALKRRWKHLMPTCGNPFAGVYMPYKPNKPAPVPHPWLARFVHTADKKGLASVSAIALFAFELEARVSHFPHKMTVDHFRGPNHEDQVFVSSEKTHEEAWFYLENDDGEPLYPRLTRRLAELKGDRTSGFMFLCERADTARPWRREELGAVVAEICTEAGLPPIKLSQFRKGGLAESGAAGLSPEQVTSQSQHKNYAVVYEHYTERNAETAMGGQELRLKYRKRKAKRGVDIVT